MEKRRYTHMKEIMQKVLELTEQGYAHIMSFIGFFTSFLEAARKRCRSLFSLFQIHCQRRARYEHDDARNGDNPSHCGDYAVDARALRAV